MDAEIDLHSVQTMSGSASASHDLGHIFSSSSSSTFVSSSLSSPLNHLSLSKSSKVHSPSSTSDPPSSPQQLQGGQNCIMSISFTPAIPGTCPAPLFSFLTKEEALRSIRESKPHSWKLAQLHTSERGYEKEAISYKKAVRRQSKDLYLIVSMYALVQGAIFTAIAQSSIFTCEDRWGPVGLVGAVTLGTGVAVLDKLRYMRNKRQEAKRFERRRNDVHDKIMLLYWRGSLCEIEDLEPTQNSDIKDDAGRVCIFCARGLSALGFLVGFSALMIACCMLMLKCPPCRCHA